MFIISSVGTHATGTRLAEYCGHALLALEVLIHPRGLPLSDFHSSFDDYKAVGHSPDTTNQPGEPESEDDDLIENWLGKDDEMEIQVTERQQDTHYADKPRDSSPDKFSFDKVASATEKDEVKTLGNGPNDLSALVENNVTAKSNAIYEVGKEIGASTSEHVSEATGNELSAVVERISATLSNTDRSKGMMFESDNESVDTLPDIIDGDPDSD